MAIQNLRNLLLLSTLLLANFHSQSPRLHVEGRTMSPKEAPTTAEPDVLDLTTQQPESFTTSANTLVKKETAIKAADMQQSLTHPTTTTESLIEATTSVTGLNNHINLETER